MAETAKQLETDEQELAPFIAFVDELRLAGYHIGVGQYIAVHNLILALLMRPDREVVLRQFEFLLGPLLCSSPSEQREFARRYTRWSGRFDNAISALLEKAQPIAPPQPDLGEDRPAFVDVEATASQPHGSIPKSTGTTDVSARTTTSTETSTETTVENPAALLVKQQQMMAAAGIGGEPERRVRIGRALLGTLALLVVAAFLYILFLWVSDPNPISVSATTVPIAPPSMTQEGEATEASAQPRPDPATKTVQPPETSTPEPTPDNGATGWLADWVTTGSQQWGFWTIVALSLLAIGAWRQRWVCITSILLIVLVLGRFNPWLVGPIGFVGLIALCIAVVMRWRQWWTYAILIERLLSRYRRSRNLLVRYASRREPDLHRISMQSTRGTLFPTLPLLKIATEFRRRLEIPSNDLHVAKTIQRTIARGGWFTPVYNDRQILPEYLALVDRRHYRDHLANLMDELIIHLQQNDVFIDVFYFDSDPRICIPATGIGISIRLEDLAVKYQDRRLLLFTEGSGLFDLFSGKLAGWADHFLLFDQRTLLTPEPPALWSNREQALAERFTVLPATLEGLECLSQQMQNNQIVYEPSETGKEPLPQELNAESMRWLENEPLEASLVEDAIDGLGKYLDDAGLLWLRACAVYPDIDWNLTLYLGNTLWTENDGRLMRPDRLLDLSRLPWFRFGYMPDWLRQHLITSLPAEQDARIRGGLNALLETVQLDTEEAAIEIATPAEDEFALALKDEHPVHDHVFLRYMSGHIPQSAFVPPESLVQLLRGQRKPFMEEPLSPDAIDLFETSDGTFNGIAGQEEKDEKSKDQQDKKLPFYQRNELLFIDRNGGKSLRQNEATSPPSNPVQAEAEESTGAGVE